MIIIYSIIYSILSLMLFIYGIINHKAKLDLFSYALALNIFPLIIVPYLGMDAARIAGIPVAYVPMIASGVVLFIYNGFKIHKKDKGLAILMVIFLSYTLIVAIAKGITVLTIIYWFMWIFNFILILVAINTFSKLEEEKGIAIIKKIFMIFFFGSLVGIFRYVIGIENNSNFMPMFNRNGTVVMVVMLTPLIFYLLENKRISNFLFWFMYLTIFLCLVLLQSRSGFLGFVLLSFLYMMFAHKIQLWKIILLSFLTVGFLVSPVGNKISDRLSHAVVSTSVIASGSTIKAGESDYKRNMLILSALTIIQNEFWFGAGIGLDNYRKAFHKHVDFFDHDSKAHNFYLSYFAELGLIGFSILMTILVAIYRKLSNNKKSIAFRISYWGMAFMMLMNEYIGLPELWFFYGILIGISYVEKKDKFNNKLRAGV